MSVLRTGVYANDTTPLWQSDIADEGGSAVQMINLSAGSFLKITNITNGQRRKIYAIDIPPDFKGKACLITTCVRAYSIVMASGTTCTLSAELGVFSTNNAGTSALEQSISISTLPIVTAREMGFNMSMVVVPPGNSIDGIYFTNNTGVDITSVAIQMAGYSIQAIDTTATDNNSLLAVV